MLVRIFLSYFDHLFICHICFYLYNYWGENVRFQIILLQSKYLFGIDIAQAKNVGPGKFEKKNKCRECLENLHELPYWKKI